MTALLEHLQARSRNGRKLLVPYVMAGIPDARAFPGVVEQIAGYADAVEVGLPYSDPLMDGPVIASAGERALRNGIGPSKALDLMEQVNSAEVPRVVMTYYNPIHRIGEDAFCERVARAGGTGLIVPDLPLEESASLRECAARHGLGWVPLVAPTSSPERVEAAAASCTGFVYAVSSLGVTGVRESLSERAEAVAKACKAATDLPVLVGIGVSNGAQAVEAARHADGVVIGSALVRAISEEGSVAAVELLRDVRAAMDAG